MTNVSIKRGQSKRVCSGEREKGRAKPKDLNSNITSIQYNCLNLPSEVTVCKTDASINPFHTSENVKVEYELDDAIGMEIPILYFLFPERQRKIRTTN